MTEYEWLPAPAFLTKIKLLPLIPKTADVDVWLKNLNRATRKEKNPDRKRRMKIISEEVKGFQVFYVNEFEIFAQSQKDAQSIYDNAVEERLKQLES